MVLSRGLVSSLTLPFALLAALSACGGGGGGGSAGGGGTPPTSPPLSGSGTLSILNAPLNAGTVVYSCGCSAQAGLVNTDANGNFAMPASAAATPSAPSPTYTLGPDRNYLIVGSLGTPGSFTEAWTMQFVAQHRANNLFLNATNTSDVNTAAGALYIYYETLASGSGDQAFDQWNFNQIAAWVNALKTTSFPAEQKLLADITHFQGTNQSLYPVPPTWNRSQPNSNAFIRTDIIAVHNQTPADPVLPTPCPPSGCTGTPTP